MRQPKDLGVALSLDDFGSGYSSLSYLRQFPFDIVKIDRSFTANVPTDTATRSIVGAMIDLSHVLDLTVTAEGVETTRELTEITNLGVDHAQGFHLSRPLTRISSPSTSTTAQGTVPRRWNGRGGTAKASPSPASAKSLDVGARFASAAIRRSRRETLNFDDLRAAARRVRFPKRPLWLGVGEQRRCWAPTCTLNATTPGSDPVASII